MRRRREARRQVPNRRRLRLELLEDRRLLAITVDTLVDEADGSITDGDVSLRDAIALAPSGETIDFDPSLFSNGTATILLNDEIYIFRSVSIVGPAAELLVIQAFDPTPGVDDGAGYRIFRINDNDDETFIDVEMRGLTLRGGDPQGRGGAIASGENLSAFDCVLEDNFSIVEGGAIYHILGALTIDRSVIQRNRVDSTFYLDGGGIFANGGTVTIVDSVISDNRASGIGGGIYLKDVAATSISGSVISENSSRGYGGGVHHHSGTLLIQNSTISENTGSGVGSHSGEVRIANTTISGNSGQAGAGIFGSNVNLTVINTTVYGNTSHYGGGGIQILNGALTLQHATITGNLANTYNSPVIGGGGISVANSAVLLDHVIVAENRNDREYDDDIQGSVTARYSLIGVDLQSAITDAGGNIIGTIETRVDPLLGPLTDNGGRVWTQALLPGSVAIDAGDPEAVAGTNGVPIEDQRGGTFSRILRNVIDIGAFELSVLETFSFVVDTIVDEMDWDFSEGDVSLREAVLLASYFSGAETITFSPAVFGTPQTILLTDGEIEIATELSIIGPEHGLLNIDAQQKSRVFNITATAGDFALSNMAILSGRSAGFSNFGVGGAVRSNSVGKLTLNQVRIQGNTATGYFAAGGGVFALGDLVLNRSIVSGNHTSGQGGGGGGVWANGSVTLLESSVVENSTLGSLAHGGGVNAFRGVTATRSTISGNSTYGDEAKGGGIYARYGGVSLESSTVTGNKTENIHASGGGVFSHRHGVKLVQSSVSDNKTLGQGARGGGIATFFGDVWLENSTVSGNSTAGYSSEGGGIHCFYDVVILNSTVSGNSTTGVDAHGGGISTGGRNLAISHSTITDNHAKHASARGGGIFQIDWVDNRAVRINSSIFAGNTAGGSGDDLVMGTQNVLAVDFSLVGTGVMPFSGSNNVRTDHPVLAPLADNGGPTWTHALLPGSPAINAGDPGVVLGTDEIPSFDQRGEGFSRVSGQAIDIGAFELDLPDAFSFVVDTTADELDANFGPGDVSLREAILLAPLYAGIEQITFDPGVFGTPKTIELVHGEFQIKEALRIDATALAVNVTIDAKGHSRIFNFSATTGDFAIIGLDLVGGKTVGHNAEYLDTTFSGGAIRSLTTGTLTVERSVVRDNGTYGMGASGGGIFALGALTISQSSVIQNFTNGDGASGGGIRVEGSVTITQSTISGNSTAGSGARGGGLYSRYAAGIFIDRSTISNNRTDGDSAEGGAVFSWAPVALLLSTVSGNTTSGANSDGGGIWAFASTLTQSVVTANQALHATSKGGGLYQLNSEFEIPLVISGSILSDNFAVGGMPNLSMDDQSELEVNYSLVGTEIVVTTGENNIFTNDPRLGPLAKNGGPTLTHALLPGSPAIDAGDPAAVAGVNGVPEFDQRGGPWSRVAGGRIDIGAVESQANPLTGDYNFNGIVDAADYSLWRDTLGATTDLRADGDGDGSVDADDYGVWVSHFGEVLEQGAGGRPASQVPRQGVEDGEALAASQRLAGEGGDEILSALAVREESTRNAGFRRAVRSRLFAHAMAQEVGRDLLMALGQRAKRVDEVPEIKFDLNEQAVSAAVDEVFARVGARRWRLR